MPDDVRLYMFECGTLKCHVENIKMNQGLGDEYEIPVPWFLVTHPSGNVVIDGGNAAECATDARGHWGDTCDVYWPTMTARAGPACPRCGPPASTPPTSALRPAVAPAPRPHRRARATIDEFPNATVHRDAHGVRPTRTRPTEFAARRLHPGRLVKPGIDWQLLEDHRRRLRPLRRRRDPHVADARATPPGHQSFEVTLPQTRFRSC